jgi:hypothetical protein
VLLLKRIADEARQRMAANALPSSISWEIERLRRLSGDDRELESGFVWKHRCLVAERLAAQVVGFSHLQRKNLMTKLKLLAAAAVLATVMVAPAMAQQAYYRGHDGYRDRGPVDDAVGIAGAVVGTAAAVATSPFRGSYAYDDGYRHSDEYARRNGFVCQPGTWFRGEDGRRHICQ